MKKIFSALAALVLAALFAAPASAQVSYHLQNSGRIWDRVETNASVTDGGTANSVGKSAHSAIASGWVQSLPIAGGQQLGLGGAVETTGSSMGFNVSTGNGTGYTKSEGWADANVKGHNTFTNQHGTITMQGVTDSGMDSPVGHGIDTKVVAMRNQDGYAAGADGGSFNIGGYTQQLPIAGGAQVSAGVSDSKTSHSSAEAGGVTFTDGVPAGQTAAYRHANSGNVTEASASFYDPFGN